VKKFAEFLLLEAVSLAAGIASVRLTIAALEIAIWFKL
jgi:hypothetical protein